MGETKDVWGDRYLYRYSNLVAISEFRPSVSSVEAVATFIIEVLAILEHGAESGLFSETEKGLQANKLNAKHTLLFCNHPRL